MTTRAYVTSDFAFAGVAVYLVEDHGEGNHFIGLPAEIEMQRIDDDATAAVQPPTLRLPESMARALLDALAAHFGGTSDTQTLRKDYLAERARVDKMIDNLIRP